MMITSIALTISICCHTYKSRKKSFLISHKNSNFTKNNFYFKYLQKMTLIMTKKSPKMVAFIFTWCFVLSKLWALSSGMRFAVNNNSNKSTAIIYAGWTLFFCHFLMLKIITAIWCNIWTFQQCYRNSFYTTHAPYTHTVHVPIQSHMLHYTNTGSVHMCQCSEAATLLVRFLLHKLFTPSYR